MSAPFGPRGRHGRALDALRRNVATELEVTPTPLRQTVVEGLCLDTGGSLTAPGPGYGSHMAELSLLGVATRGNTIEHAIASWIRAVVRMARDDAEARATAPGQVAA
ncbi:MAG: hypothetical protein ACWA5A_09390 [Marinibacterium sp.]